MPRRAKVDVVNAMTLGDVVGISSGKSSQLKNERVGGWFLPWVYIGSADGSNGFFMGLLSFTQSRRIFTHFSM